MWRERENKEEKREERERKGSKNRKIAYKVQRLQSSASLNICFLEHISIPSLCIQW